MKFVHSYITHPPLSCRTSPPQGGRSAFIDISTNLQGCKVSETVDVDVISPLVGEMAGKPEGGEYIITHRSLTSQRGLIHGS
ncbi:hypothetical protein C5750_23090 [Phyllobacterium myrsinacearum]|uniref:Uncharacterized protein n=1 Tax=Phyllobacterium myrsinacearum TaxID=28101 RepID=A0A2S9JC59_9HYPH|nr:hypothetical protein C5750_23090 [Phyllobacterium myrsinacearum]